MSGPDKRAHDKVMQGFEGVASGTGAAFGYGGEHADEHSDGSCGILEFRNTMLKLGDSVGGILG